MKYVYYGDPRLSHSCAEMGRSEIDLEFRKNVAAMIKKSKRKNGVGLAACQIGDMRRYFVFGKKVAINPILLEQSEEEVIDTEGCLSVPNVYAKVSRPKKIKVSYFDLNWNEVEIELHGMESRIFLHELDHLNGIMFFERASKEEQEKIKESLEKVKEVYANI